MVTSLSALLVILLSSLEPAASVLGWVFAPGMMLPAAQDEVVDLGDPVAVVQIELLPDPDSAELLAANIQRRLGELQLEVFVEVVPAEIDLPPSYRVNVGPFDSFEDAERARTELDTLGVDGFVRELQPLVGC
jgi:cell division septation protein DedD